MPAFPLAFVFLPLQPLPLKSRPSNERTFDSSRVSSSQQQQCPDRPRVFCDQMGTVEQPLGHSHKRFKSRANDAQMGWQSGLHSRSNRLVMLSAQGGVILLFCQVSITYHLTSLWAHVSTNYQFFSYLCAIACLKTIQPQVFAALLCDHLCRSSTLGCVESTFAGLNSVFSFPWFLVLNSSCGTQLGDLKDEDRHFFCWVLNPIVSEKHLAFLQASNLASPERAIDFLHSAAQLCFLLSIWGILFKVRKEK